MALEPDDRSVSIDGSNRITRIAERPEDDVARKSADQARLPGAHERDRTQGLVDGDRREQLDIVGLDDGVGARLAIVGRRIRTGRIQSTCHIQISDPDPAVAFCGLRDQVVERLGHAGE